MIANLVQSLAYRWHAIEKNNFSYRTQVPAISVALFLSEREFDFHFSLVSAMKKAHPLDLSIQGDKVWAYEIEVGEEIPFYQYAAHYGMGYQQSGGASSLVSEGSSSLEVATYYVPEHRYYTYSDISLNAKSHLIMQIERSIQSKERYVTSLIGQLVLSF